MYILYRALVHLAPSLHRHGPANPLASPDQDHHDTLPWRTRLANPTPTRTRRRRVCRRRRRRQLSLVVCELLHRRTGPPGWEGSFDPLIDRYCRALPQRCAVDRKGPDRADTCEVLCTNNCFNFKPSLLRRRQKHKTGKCQAIHEMLQQQQQPSWMRLTKLFYDQDTCRWPGHIYEIFYRPVHWVQSLSAASNVPQTTFDQPSWWVWPFCVVPRSLSWLRASESVS